MVWPVLWEFRDTVHFRIRVPGVSIFREQDKESSIRKDYSVTVRGAAFWISFTLYRIAESLP